MSWMNSKHIWIKSGKFTDINPPKVFQTLLGLDSNYILLYPILKSTMTAGENDWTLSYENDVGSFVLYESKPLFKK